MKLGSVVGRMSMLCACALAACGEEKVFAEGTSASLPADTAAQVGAHSLKVEAILQVQAATGVSFEQARKAAVEDMLVAEHARANPEMRGLPRHVRRTVLARVLLAQLSNSSSGVAAPTDAEIQARVRERWLQYDRPEAVRTTHVVVRVKKPEQEAAALELAGKIAAAVRGIAEPRDFMERATEAATDSKLEVRAERLPPVTAAGRVVNLFNPDQESGQFDRQFAQAAHALKEPGQQSPVVKTPFGYHVILMEERLAEQRLPQAERRSHLEAEVLRVRARPKVEQLLGRLRKETPVRITRAADRLTARVLSRQ